VDAARLHTTHLLAAGYVNVTTEEWDDPAVLADGPAIYFTVRAEKPRQPPFAHAVAEWTIGRGFDWVPSLANTWS
jgi:hypothetical protein